MASSKNLTPSQRAMRARIAAHTRWSQTDSVEGTAAARNAGPGRIDYWERKVDPDSTLPDKERRRRAENAKKAHYSELAYKSAQARAAKKKAS